MQFVTVFIPELTGNSSSIILSIGLDTKSFIHSTTSDTEILLPLLLYKRHLD